MIGVDFDKGQMKRLEDALASVGKGGSKYLGRELITAVNATAKRGQSITAKELSKNVSLPQKVLKKHIRVDKAKRGIADPRASVTIHGATRFSLKEFGARQTKKGVSYKSRGRTANVPSAFIVNSLGGHVFIRHGGKVRMSKGRSQGKLRQPIRKLWGPSVVVAALKNRTKPIVIKDITPEFHAQIEKRIRTHVRKAMGKY